MYQNLHFPLFFRSHFLTLMVPEKSKNPRNPNNAKGRRQGKNSLVTIKKKMNLLEF